MLALARCYVARVETYRVAAVGLLDQPASLTFDTLKIPLPLASSGV